MYHKIVIFSIYFFQKTQKAPEIKDFCVRVQNCCTNMADDYNSPQKCPFSDVETTKNLGYDSRQYLLGILYSILPPLSILSKAFILQWVKGENIHEKKGGRRMLFPSVARAVLPLYSDALCYSRFEMEFQGIGVPHHYRIHHGSE